MLSYYVILILLPALTSGAELNVNNVTAVQLFEDVDLNNDSNVVRSEIDAFFKAFDTDMDDEITQTEFETFFSLHYPAYIKYEVLFYDTFDVSGDHILEMYDFEILFGEGDVNKDGILTEHEFIDFFSMVLSSVELLISLHVELGFTPSVG